MVQALRIFVMCCVAITPISCASPRIILPEGPGEPFPKYAEVFAAAVSECSRVRSFEALVALRGRGQGGNVRGRIRVGFVAPGSVRLEGLAPFGAPVFLFVATPSDVTLWFVRRAQAVSGVPAADVLDRLTGIPFGPEDLRAVLTGCLVPEAEPIGGRSYGDWIAVDLARGAVAYLRPSGDEYHLVAGIRDGLTVWYDEFRRQLPRQVRVVSDDGGSQASVPVTDLTARLSQVSVNVEIPEAAFTLRIPPDVTPVSLEDLFRAPPLAGETGQP